MAAAPDVRPSTFAGDVVIALLALAMGVRNATVRRLGVPDLTTTVLTMTLTGLAADSRVAGGSGQGSARRIAAVVAMLAGALAGALLLKISLVPPLLAAAALAPLGGAGVRAVGRARRQGRVKPHRRVLAGRDERPGVQPGLRVTFVGEVVPRSRLRSDRETALQTSPDRLVAFATMRSLPAGSAMRRVDRERAAGRLRRRARLDDRLAVAADPDGPLHAVAVLVDLELGLEARRRRLHLQLGGRAARCSVPATRLVAGAPPLSSPARRAAVVVAGLDRAAVVVAGLDQAPWSSAGRGSSAPWLAKAAAGASPTCRDGEAESEGA